MSFAVMDDGFGINTKKSTTEMTKKFKSEKDKKLVMETIKVYKRTLASEAKSISKVPRKRRSLGAVPSYIQENWNALSKDQKEIVYSYHNENPFAVIAKDYFKKNSVPTKKYEHNTDYGFDLNEQNSLDNLRTDINGSSKDQLSLEDQKIIDVIAALEK